MLVRRAMKQRGFLPKVAPNVVRHSGTSTTGQAEVTEKEQLGLLAIAERIENASNIVVMLGAGVSVSAGIPDFRTPGTGLYDNLQKYDLPYAEAIFDLDFFLDKPDAFYTLCKELWPGTYKPTPTHHFVSLLHAKKKLRRCLTQNIDSLETQAGLPKNMCVAAHGNFDSATCTSTGEKVDPAEVRAAVFADHDADGSPGWVGLSETHGGLVKPDIVFFGEALPPTFFRAAQFDVPECDLLLLAGTSLEVFPFAGLVHEVPKDVPRILINRDRVGESNGISVNQMQAMVSGKRGLLDFGDNSEAHWAQGGDCWLGGECDEAIWKLSKLLGWEADLAAAVATENGHCQQL